MKKLVIFGAGLLLAAGAVFFAIHTKPLAAEEALLLANVEAIAQNEDDGPYIRGTQHHVVQQCPYFVWEGGVPVQKFRPENAIVCYGGNDRCTESRACY